MNTQNVDQHGTKHADPALAQQTNRLDETA
jgi:hypothetical protein